MRMWVVLFLCLCASVVRAQDVSSTTTTEPAAGASTKPAIVYGQPISTDINAGQMVSYRSGEDSNGREISAYLVRPVMKGVDVVMPSVVVVPDIFGMTSWIKQQAELLAKQGYTVLVPDLYSRLQHSENGFDAAQAWVAYDKTSDQQVMEDISGAIAFLQADGKPTAGQPLGIVGYDMGGIYAMMMAGTDLRVTAAVNFYGRVLYTNTTPLRPVSPVEHLFNLQAPLLSFYGTLDPQVPESQVAALESRLLHNPNETFYEIVRLPGVGHGFLVPTRQGYNARASGEAEAKVRTFLARYLRAEPKKADE